ncbi:MAG: DNA repair protein RadA [Firmicutes bacterium HGW-Firmicutes-1]|jgi:DNA repair protein RadA/Sms|nr:MAG: DNA repair protein RadA [Firmicutes bacterium HGW-Firmicutes-1]
MSKTKTVFMCQECGYESPKWMGQCPGCSQWNTLVEELKLKKPVSNFTNSSIDIHTDQKPRSLSNIDTEDDNRLKTNIQEFDRVLGGGIVDGSLTLVGGDPGIGKSTILLQMCQSLSEQGTKILYISGEESLKQIKMRADRLDVKGSNVMLYAQTSLQIIETVIGNEKPNVVIVDSIQTMFSEDVTSAPGSVSQVREVTSRLLRIAKGLNVSIFIVGHVTKDGSIAGPRVLEHMVDTVLYFEGERSVSYRILRAVKNRYGSTDEIGVFEMRDKGLVEVSNPSEYMLTGRPLGEAGSIVTCCMEGTRPLLVEVQALVSPTSFGMPRRASTGTDYNRVNLLMAVLEKKIGMQLGNYDSYVNIAGGIKISEPSLDLGIIIAIASSFKNASIDEKTIIMGEVGLTGEVRGISLCDKRILEAEKLGFTRCIIPKANYKALDHKKGKIEIIGVESVREAIEFSLGY